jgi:uncharacterized protein (TIGR03790 family)
LNIVRIAPFCSVLTATLCLAQDVPLKDRVLVLVNDRVPKEAGTGNEGASVFVGRYYAARRNIPAANIFHVKAAVTEETSMEDYKAQIEAPLRKFLDANGGAMRKKILYIVPTYGVPLKIDGKFAVDSVLVMMYAGHDDVKPPLKNPYSAAVGSRPPHFDVWSDQLEAVNGGKMFLVSRLDGPGAMIAKGLVDKAMAAESGLTMKSGVGYFDYQGTRHPGEWQLAIDEEIKAASELSTRRGFDTVLHTQITALCGTTLPAATQYYYDADAKAAVVDARGSTAGTAFSFPPLTEGDFTIRVQARQFHNTGNSVSFTLAGTSAKSYIRLFYPFVPFKQWDTAEEIVLEKLVEGVVTARTALRVANDGKVMNEVSEFRISVRHGRVKAYRNGTELLAAEDKDAKKAAALPVAKLTMSANCWNYAIKGFTVTDAGGKTVWDDNFQTDSTAKYEWPMSPLSGPNALWVWGWYGAACDSYRFVPGAIGAQLTSYTADRIRTPVNAAPRFYSVDNVRWGGNWVPRMLEQGVTATWGAVTEPYAVFYAPGGNVLDHFWAGYNFGESFYIAQNAVRWVMVAIGDPLYAPAIFAQKR